LTLAGALGWAAATTAGVLTAGLAHRPGSARGRSPAASLALGGLVAGALTPLVALAVATLAGGAPAGAVAAWSGLGWLLAGALALLAGRLRLRADLLDAGPRGERARTAAAAVTGAGEMRALAGVLIAAVTFSAWVALLSVLPALVVVLVPLHVVLVVAARRAGTPPDRRTGAAAAALGSARTHR
jgi:hypothetical protein